MVAPKALPLRALPIIAFLLQKSKALHNLFYQILHLLALKVVFDGFLRQKQTLYLHDQNGPQLYNKE